MSLNGIILPNGSADFKNRADINVNSIMIGKQEIDKSCVVQIKSDSKGLGLPCMTTQQRMAIENPVQGLILFDLSIGKLCLFDGTAWIMFVKE